MTQAKEIELSEIIMRKATERRGHTFVSTPAIEKYMYDQRKAQEANDGIGKFEEEIQLVDPTKQADQKPAEDAEKEQKGTQEENIGTDD
jgi:hypothetical protein